MKALTTSKLENLLEGMPEQIRKKLMKAILHVDGLPLDEKIPYGKKDYRYTSLQAMHDTLKPICEKFGMCYKHIPQVFKDEDKDLWVEIVMVLSDEDHEHHIRGFALPIDGRQKNMIHAIGSTVTYGRRYLTSCVFSVASETDLDASDVKTVSPSQRTSNPRKKRNKKARVNAEIHRLVRRHDISTSDVSAEVLDLGFEHSSDMDFENLKKLKERVEEMVTPEEDDSEDSEEGDE